MKRIIKLIIATISIICLWANLSFAQNSTQSDISIIPEGGWNRAAEAVNEVWVWWQVRKNYRKIVDANELSLWDQFASWIMSRNTILDYIVYLVKFLSWLTLLVWAVAIIYLWYKKIALQYFSKQPPAFVMVIVWVLIVTFAYAIVKLLRSAFVS